MARLRRPLGAWRLVDDVGADRRDRRWRTADRWLDTRRRVNSDQTETFTESLDHSDWNPIFNNVLLSAQIDGFGLDLILWIELHEFYKFALSIEAKLYLDFNLQHSQIPYLETVRFET